MTITLIAATTNSRVIADSQVSGMLWHNKAELAHFKRETIGKTCVVGLKTALAMPVLKGRSVFVLIDGDHLSASVDISRYPDNYDFLLTDTTDAKLCIDEFIQGDDEVMVIGGAKTYARFMDVADKAIISTVFDDEVVGDVYMPNFTGHWKVTDTKADLDGGFMTRWFLRV
jgi:dihydrofolate reductase